MQFNKHQLPITIGFRIKCGQELRYWDLNEAKCIRTIQLDFLSGARKRTDPFTKKLLIIEDDLIFASCADQIATIQLATGTSRKGTDDFGRNNQRRSDEETAASEEKIPIRFRETLLDFGAREEDSIFDDFFQELKCIFGDSPSAERYLAEAHQPPEADLPEASGYLIETFMLIFINSI